MTNVRRLPPRIAGSDDVETLRNRGDAIVKALAEDRVPEAKERDRSTAAQSLSATGPQKSDRGQRTLLFALLPVALVAGSYLLCDGRGDHVDRQCLRAGRCGRRLE